MLCSQVAVPVVNMAMDDSELDVRAESVHGDGNPLIRQNTSDTETIDGREESEMGLEDPVPQVEEDEVVLTPPRGVEVRAVLEELDRLNPCFIFEQRASLMKKVPKFLRGPFRNALKFALEEAIARDEVRQSRGWKLFMMLPRMLLHRPPGGGLISKSSWRPDS